MRYCLLGIIARSDQTEWAMSSLRKRKNWGQGDFMKTVILAFCLISPEAIELQYGLPSGLLRSMQYVESRGGTGEHRVIDVVNDTQKKYLRKISQHLKQPISLFTGSSAGAMGVMQIIPSTFWVYKQDGNGDGHYDPLCDADSYATAAYYVARLIAVHGSLEKALNKYSGGASGYYEKVMAQMAFK